MRGRPGSCELSRPNSRGSFVREFAQDGLNSLQFLLLLVVAKTLATSVSLASGFVGGVFSPSLFIGAMVGGAFGVIATAAFPELSSGHGAYTLIGMGAVAGARAPSTAMPEPSNKEEISSSERCTFLGEIGSIDGGITVSIPRSIQ